MMRSAAISAAVAGELAAHRALLDAVDGPHTLTLVVKLGADGQPCTLIFRPEWIDKPRKRHATK